MSLKDAIKKEFSGRKGVKYLLGVAMTGSGIAGMAADPSIPGAGYIAAFGGVLLAITFIFIAPDEYVAPSPPSSSFEVPPDDDLDPLLIVTYPAENGFLAAAMSGSGATVAIAGPFDKREAAIAALDGVPADVPVYDVDEERAKALEAVEPHRKGWFQDALPILQVIRESSPSVGRPPNAANRRLE